MTAQPPPVLQGKVAIVTGAGGGIGREEALALAAHGARVVVNALSDSCEQVAEEIRGQGGEAIAARGSVADAGAAEGVMRAAVDKYGQVDILVNNVGVSFAKPLEEATTEEFQDLFNVNVVGHFNMMRLLIPAMKARRSGRIVNTSSGTWRNPKGNVVYGASKAAVVSLTYGAAWELRDYGVTCNAICPFGMTAGVQRGIAAFSRLSGSQSGLSDLTQMLKNFPSPKYAAPLVVYLASDAAAGVSGFIFRSGGGRITMFPHPFETNLISMDISSEENWTYEELAERIPAEVLSGQELWWVEEEKRS
jgi:NAD(P)-dependent dehydrogenase (short-subunit alcohol dehydrogenase family)